MLGNEMAYGGNLSVLESTLKQRRCDIRWRAIEETVDAEKEKKEQKLCRSKLYRDSGVWQHVTVTRAFQLIKNKRCERPTVENR